jgi:YHS domain-containing protein
VNGNGILIKVPDKTTGDQPARVTLRLVAGNDRLILHMEKKAGDAFSRLAELGATRKGSGFGKGATYIECIVTGGLGTIEVSHEGKTYHVCCTGCLEVFKDDPAGTIKDYLARKAEEKAKQAGAENSNTP